MVLYHQPSSSPHQESGEETKTEVGGYIWAKLGLLGFITGVQTFQVMVMMMMIMNDNHDDDDDDCRTGGRPLERGWWVTTLWVSCLVRVGARRSDSEHYRYNLNMI